MELLIVFLAGGCGAFIEDILCDNCVTLPKIISGKLILGSVGGIIIGAFAGLMIDGSFTTAFMAGFTGKAVIKRLMDGNLIEIKKNLDKYLNKAEI